MLEYLLTHGPESVAEEFKSDKDVINQMKGFQYIDDTGYFLSSYSCNSCLKIYTYFLPLDTGPTRQMSEF